MVLVRRLVYAPKAYVFVRSYAQNGRIYNLSPDVVSGEVVRNVGDLSTATVVLRNRFRKWLKDPGNGMSIFLPMDMVTIYLQRINGKPIQVFTGYLDSVPYYQMYPGNCQITASCTLKRLNNTWFDPGVEWFINWATSIPGWNYNRYTGEARSPFGMIPDGTTGVDLGGHPQAKLNDGGFADIIQRFMIDVANWAPHNIIVSDLPTNLPQVAARLYRKVNAQDVIAEHALEQLLSSVMGISASPIDATTQDSISQRQITTMKAIKKSSSAANLPIQMLVTAAIMCSGFKPGFAKREARASQTDDWGYGLYAMKPKITQSVDHRSHNSTVAIEANTIEGVSKSKLSNPGLATDLFCKRLHRVNTVNASGPHGRGQYDMALHGDQGAMKQWVESALNRNFTADQWSACFSQAKQYISAYAHPNQQSDSGSQGLSTPQGLAWSAVTPDSGTNTAVMDSLDFETYSKYYRNVNDSLAPYYWMAKTHYSGIHLESTNGSSRSTLVLGGSTDDLQSFFDGVKNHHEYDTITISKTSGHETQLITYKSGKLSGHSPIPTGSNSQVSTEVIIQVGSNATYPEWTFNVPGVSNTGATTTDRPSAAQGAAQTQMTNEDIGRMSFAATFAAHYTLSTNFVESKLLTGYKALANDISCMDGIKQFCQASMRQFMSLPNGNFCAFYPDYFGAHGRKPYWYIYDIEITNGGVVLSDDQLATHVYTIGDVANNDYEINEMDYVRSGGVVTMDMGVLAGFINPLENQDENSKTMNGNEPLGVLKTAADFMYHYGARPYKEEVPQIRNQFFEFLYAWQRFMQKWAATFQTTIEFTFQPEIMCGGIIGFPQHNLQMYCERVTHTWDYGSGFNTSAELSSPAAMSSTSPGDIGSLPGFAMAGNINSVGVAAS